jgi:hypothetical protein
MGPINTLRPCSENMSAPNTRTFLIGSGIRQPTITCLYPASRDMVGLTETDSCCQELVTFDEGDPEDPVNWSARKKQAVVAILCVLSFVS